MEAFKLVNTERTMIKILGMQDKEAFFSYRSLPEVYRYQSWIPIIIKDAEEFIQKNDAANINAADTWVQFAVFLKNETLIGDIGIHFLEDISQIEIGYTLSPKYQGKGYATEAVRAMLDYLFKDLKKHRITASVDPRNTPSIRLLEKLKFRKEAHFIKSFPLNGAWCDDLVYAILEEEWR